jgi:hypothetical protein
MSGDADTREEENQMDETNHAPTGAAGRVDVNWGRITRQSESGSFIEDRLAGLSDAVESASRFRVDVVHLGPDQVPEA